jgi:hypothetical protein
MLFTERATMSTISVYKTPAGIGIDDACPTPAIPDPRLAVFVIFTSISETLKALERAQQIAEPVGATVHIVAAQVVPYPLQLDQPPVSLDFLIREFEAKADGHLDNTQISIYLCRDREEALRRVLSFGCPVVIGIRKRWLPTWDECLAKKLRRIGYDVLSVAEERCNA